MWIKPTEAELALHFACLDRIFQLPGTPISQSSMSDVVRYSVGDRTFYVKRYWQAGKGLRRWIGRSRIRGEWENVQLFSELNIPTAPLIAYGEESFLGLFKRGAMITEEIPSTNDLAALARRNDSCFQNTVWVQTVMDQIAEYTARLHQKNFVHYDLKWRNILVTNDMQNPKVFFIDCPIGRYRRGVFLKHGKRKDLRALDKLASLHLSNSMRRYFYKRYLNHTL